MSIRPSEVIRLHVQANTEIWGAAPLISVLEHAACARTADQGPVQSDMKSSLSTLLLLQYRIF